MNLYDKIDTLIKNANITVSELEKNLGFGNGSIKRWKTSSPSCDKILLISDYFNVSLDYLLRSEIENNLTDKTTLSLPNNIDILNIYNSLSERQQTIIKGKLFDFEDDNKKEFIAETITPLRVVETQQVMPAEEIDQAEYVTRPLYSHKASAGIGKYLYDNPEHEDTIFDLNEYPQARRADHVIAIEGDSMKPTIQNGQYIFVREQASIEHNEIGVFVYQDNVYCKRLHIDRKNKRLILVSDNEDYDDILIENLDELRTIGKVIL